MRSLLIVAIAMFLFMEGNCRYPVSKKLHPNIDQVDWDLSLTMGLEKRHKNVIISPMSLKIVLSLLLDASNGATADELAKLLRLDSDNLNKDSIRTYYKELIRSLNVKTEPTLTSDVRSKIFADKAMHFNEAYLKIAKDNYDADMEGVDFKQVEAIETVNKWAKNVTHGHLPKLLASVEPDTVLLLVNVVFFNGLWAHPFDESRTTTEPFHVSAKQKTQTQMMKAEHNLKYAESPDGELQLLRMPYQGGSFAMYIILPHSRKAMNKLLSDTPNEIHSLMALLYERDVVITIPKFKYTYESNALKSKLNDLGVQSVFSKTADLTNLGGPGLYVSDILQKAGVEVTEKGTTAYAATVAEISYRSSFGGPVEFKANRPFLFLIADEKTKTVVFLGKVNVPGTGIKKTK